MAECISETFTVLARRGSSQPLIDATISLEMLSFAPVGRPICGQPFEVVWTAILHYTLGRPNATQLTATMAGVQILEKDLERGDPTRVRKETLSGSIITDQAGMQDGIATIHQV